MDYRYGCGIMAGLVRGGRGLIACLLAAVMLVGSPLGLGHTVTHGIVSQTGRQIVPVESGKP
jgi:hypothetical protein